MNTATPLYWASHARMLKVELHTHTSDDPRDDIAHSAHELIDRASDLGYDAIAITLHNKQLDVCPLVEYASQRGLLLIPGIERDIRGKHVLLLNFSMRAETVESFEDLAELKRQEPAGLVVAPHPFFPAGSCLGRMMNRHPDLFDAVEVNAMYARSANFNRAGERWARAHGKPVVGNGDVHRLEQLGTTYSLVDAAPSPDAICEAIRQGQVQVSSTPLPLRRAVWIFAKILLAEVVRSARRVFGMPVRATDRGLRQEKET